MALISYEVLQLHICFLKFLSSVCGEGNLKGNTLLSG